MGSSDKAYISAENATHAVTWLPPQVGKQANKIPSVEKEAKEAKRRATARAKESVEDVEPVKPLKLPTADEIAEVFDAARKEGFAEGLGAGTAQGLELGRAEGAEKSYTENQAEFEQLKSTLSQLILNLSGPTELQQSQLSQMLTQVVKRLTRKLVMSELSTPSPHIENLVSACVRLLPATQATRKARIQLHPDDLAYLRGEAQMASILSECEWVADAEVVLGGCLVSANSSQLDASVESQLQALFESFDNGSFSHDAADEIDIQDDAANVNVQMDSSGGSDAERSIAFDKNSSASDDKDGNSLSVATDVDLSDHGSKAQRETDAAAPSAPDDESQSTSPSSDPNVE